MESLLGRYRNLVILVGVLFLQLLGLAVQVKGSDSENTRLIRVWAVDAITPFERALVSVQNSCGNVWHNYFYLRGVRAENRQLKDQIQQMRLEQVRLSQDAEQAHRLQALLAFKEQTVAKTVAAQVIGSSGSDLSRIIYIDKGENNGLKPDMAVVTADGVVGKILLVSASVAQVLLINDQSSGVGVILEKSRLQGVLRGTPNGEVILERVMSDEQVAAGEKVLSSGGDQIFPKGMPVGTVSKVSPGKELFLDIKVKPAADLSRLEEVLVITQQKEREAVAENAGRVRAADILAERLPSVPDKPEIAVNTSGKTATSAGSAAAGAPKPADNSGTKVPGTESPASPQGRATSDAPRVVSSGGQIATPKAAVEKAASVPASASSSSAGTSGGAAVAPSGTKTAGSATKTGTAHPSAAKPAPSATHETPSQDGPH
jgi:rod shape-determining protein MreC